MTAPAPAPPPPTPGAATPGAATPAAPPAALAADLLVTTAPMRWWHVEELLPIEDELFGAERWTAGMFWSELAQPDSRWYRVALLAGQDGGPRVVGYAGLWESGDRPGAPEVWVQNLAVSRALQRRGLGARLLDELLAEAARRGAHRVALEVRADNEPAQRLYAGRGFEAVGLRRGYYQPSGIDAVVMVREDAR